jgi:hypothetical protein
VTFRWVLTGYQAVHHRSDRVACVSYRTDSHWEAFQTPPAASDRAVRLYYGPLSSAVKLQVS